MDEQTIIPEETEEQLPELEKRPEPERQWQQQVPLEPPRVEL